jgi:hypothetical protein
MRRRGGCFESTSESQDSLAEVYNGTAVAGVSGVILANNPGISLTHFADNYASLAHNL